MTSFHYMREIQKDNERRIDQANRFKPYYADDEGTLVEKSTSPGLFPRLLHGLGNMLVNLGNRLQAMSA